MFLFFGFLGVSNITSLYAQAPNGSGKAKPALTDDDAGDEVLSGPFSEYGEFDSSEDEANDEKFFQFGRFFGVGLSVGDTTATGNLGRFYFGGFPTVGARLNYWFDFNFALQLSVENNKFNYDLPPHGATDVNLFRMLIQVKYYPDTRNLSAPITFVAPHLILGGGMYRRTLNKGVNATNSVDSDVETVNSFGFNGGIGFELTLNPKKTYLQLEGLVHSVPFRDQYDKTFDTVAAGNISDLTGLFISTSIAIVWTW